MLTVKLDMGRRELRGLRPFILVPEKWLATSRRNKNVNIGLFYRQVPVATVIDTSVLNGKT